VCVFLLLFFILLFKLLTIPRWLTVWVLLRRGYIDQFVDGGLPDTLGEIEDMNLPSLLRLRDIPEYRDHRNKVVSFETLTKYGGLSPLSSSLSCKLTLLYRFTVGALPFKLPNPFTFASLPRLSVLPLPTFDRTSRRSPNRFHCPLDYRTPLHVKEAIRLREGTVVASV
jgi:hypothetical protein